MPKIVDPEERRKAIATAAVDAISAAGLDGVKLTDIARAAGVTTGAISHYFPDKDSVLAAALEDVCARLFERISEIEGMPTLDGITEALPIDDENLREWRVWLAYWGRAPFSENLLQIHQQYYLEMEAMLADKLEGHVDSPADVANAIIATVDGIGVRVTLEPEAWPPVRQKAMLHQMLQPLFLYQGLKSD